MILLTPTKNTSIDIAAVLSMINAEDNFPDEIFKNCLFYDSAQALCQSCYCNPIDRLKELEDVITDLVVLSQNTDRGLCVFASDDCAVDVCHAVMSERCRKDTNYHVLFHTEDGKFVLDEKIQYNKLFLLTPELWDKLSSLVSYMARTGRARVEIAREEERKKDSNS